MGKLQKLDNRIQILLKNGIQLNQRSIIVMVGDKGQDQVPIMFQILNSLTSKGNLRILWCYKKDLSFSSHRKKNLKLLHKKRKAGIVSEGTVFEQFVCSSDIRWCYYAETQNILGQTFDMCVLQDFEALTPNTLARTIETVAGGGLVVFLLKSMDSLRQLCTLVMDVHARFRTEAHQDCVCRFNERFILSLGQHPRCLVLDDRWRILPISRRSLANMKALPPQTSNSLSPDKVELKKLKVALSEDGSIFAPLVNICITLDQAKCLLQACASIAATSHSHLMTAKTLRRLEESNTVSGTSLAKSAIVVTTASRGRGKSAALGLGLSAAMEAGLPNLFVTAPSPDNLATLMEFFLKGLRALGYEEHVDFNVIRRSESGLSNAIVRVDVVKRPYRQSLAYLQPWEAAAQFRHVGGAQADLVCIDEAAAIPLPIVKQLIDGPKVVFMASTINGYEGTGRSLSVKLIKELRQACKVAPECKVASAVTGEPGKSLDTLNKSRFLYECSMVEAIRYANGDATEQWLNNLLCLDCEKSLYSESAELRGDSGTYPPVNHCQLYYVNRDTLFAHHKSTEVFLARLMALYVASHYKNSPNDLQMLSDAPAHHIFCLLAPYDVKSGKVPEILCVLQVCLEGSINEEMVKRGLARGLRPAGDLIPWTISQQFGNPSFGSISGARVIRIATHPEYQGMGYGSRALSLLHDYYSGNIAYAPSEDTEMSLAHGEEVGKAVNLPEQTVQEGGLVDVDDDENQPIDAGEHAMEAEETHMKASVESDPLLLEQFAAKSSSSLPPLLSRLSERRAESIDYVGTSFGVTPSLLRFWKRAGYAPIYLRQSVNSLTGEFSCIMVHKLRDPACAILSANWEVDFFLDFSRRFTILLGGQFRCLDAAFSLELLSNKLLKSVANDEISSRTARQLFSPVDSDRLKRYVNSLVDFHVIGDLCPRLAELYFARRLPQARLNRTQQTILLGIGLQRKTVEQVATEFDRLLGAPEARSDKGTLSSKRRSQAADATTLMTVQCAEEDSLASSTAALEGEDQTTGWTKRVRGLLFVVIKELYKALADILAEGEADGEDDQISAMDAESAAHEIASSDDGEDDEEEDVDPTELSNLTAEECQRRAALVKELLSEDFQSGQIKNSIVKGSKNDWSKATAVHGSNLDTLKVSVKTKESKKPMDREFSGKGKKRQRGGAGGGQCNSRSAKLLKMQKAAKKQKQ